MQTLKEFSNLKVAESIVSRRLHAMEKIQKKENSYLAVRHVARVVKDTLFQLEWRILPPMWHRLAGTRFRNAEKVRN